MQLFDFIKNLVGDKTDIRSHPDFQKNYNQWMINRVLSMNASTANIAAFLSRYPDIPKDKHYLFLLKFLDKGNIWFDYKKRSQDIDQEILDDIMEYYEVGFNKAKIIINIIGEEKVNIIRRSMNEIERKRKR